MLVCLDGKGFESALIDRARAGGLVRDMPPLRMGHGDPAEDFRELSILPRPQEKVPVSGHEAIGGDTDAKCGMGFGQNGFEGGVVRWGFKQRQSAYTAVQDVIGKVAGGKTGTAWHGRSCTQPLTGLSRKESRPHKRLLERRRIRLPRGNGLGFSGRQALSAILGNSAVDDCPAIEAFPGIKGEKEI